MNFTITLTNSLLETVNSSIINKLYDLFITNMANHVINLLGYLYSPSAYGEKVDELNLTYGPNFRIEVPKSGRFIQFLPNESSLENTIKTFLGISLDTGITEADAANAVFTQNTFAGTSANPNTSITSFSTFRYFTKANNNPPLNLFEYCTNLVNIDLSNVTRTSNYEFNQCGLTGDLSLPNLTELGKQSFGSVKISTISDLGNSIVTIPEKCFLSCPNLTSVVLPTTVTSINFHAFSAHYTSYPKVFTTITGLNNVNVFQSYCFNNQSSLNISANDINQAVAIDSEAFADVPITGNLYLKEITSLGNGAFWRSRFSKILCLNKLTAISDRCFGMPNSDTYRNTTTEVYLPFECNSIGSGVFLERTGLTTVKQYTQSIDDWTDKDTPSSYGPLSKITSFGLDCFLGCILLSLTPTDLENAVSIGSGAFIRTLVSGSLNLTKLTSLGNNAFQNCSQITEIKCLGNINQIPNNCFQKNTSIQSVYLPYECTSLSSSAFDGCSSLTTVKLYSLSINNWGGATSSSYCSDLSRITYFGIECFKDCPLLLLTNDDLLGAVTISRGALAGRVSATDLSLPNLLTLGRNAFEGNTSIQTVSNLGSITEIGDGTFYRCTSLTSITFPTTLTKVYQSVDDDTSIEKEIFPYGLTIHSGGFCRHKTATTCKYIQLPSTVTIVSLYDFARDAWSNPIRCKIIIQATTPPGNEWYSSNTGGFGNGWNWGRPYLADFYVPDVNTYLAHPHWAHEQEVAIQEGVNNGNGNIFPISLLLTDDPDLWAVYLQNKDYGVPQNNS